VEDAASETTTRRSFVNWFLGTSVGSLCLSVLYPVLSYLSPPDVAEAATAEVEAGLVNDPDYLDKGFKVVPFGPDPVIVVRVSESEFRALSATCTHLDCIVEYHSAQRLIWCNCHNGQFDLSGRNVGGPPPRPLTPFDVHLVQRAPGQPATVVVSKA
jgi:Rieske Fe-S protein